MIHIQKYVRILALQLTAWVLIGFTAGTAAAQSVPSPPLPIDPFLDALKQHGYAMAGAIWVGYLVALTKSGHLSVWLAQTIPSKWLPIWALFLGTAGTVSAAIISGQDWKQALLQGGESAVLAVFTHQVVIEGLFGGRELHQPTSKLIAVRSAAVSRIMPTSPPTQS
jgi:hypothetical protein